MTPSTNRRSFVSALGALTGIALVRPASLAAATALQTKWDFSWIDTQTGKHRQVFDLGSRDLSVPRNPLRVPRNYLNGFREVYGLADAALNTIVAIAADAFPMNASDALWVKYAIGERWKIKDPATGAWSTRNIWIENAPQQADASVRVLQSRGTIFWQCNNALNGVVAELAAATGIARETVREDLVAGLVPGVKLVPAHTMALGLVQERGFTYEKL